MLVSIAILTYNSEKTVLETLNSVLGQEYDNTEIVVSDDCSTDNTVYIIEEWMKQYRDKITIKFIRQKENLGIAANFNAAVCACKGEWIKILAGDDVLLPNCIADNVEEAEKHPEYGMLMSKEYVVNENGDIVDIPIYAFKQMEKITKLKNSYKQYRYLVKQEIGLSPTMFINRKAYLKIGGTDLRIRNIDDYPLKLNYTRNGYRIGYVAHYTVKYRVHNSVSRNSETFYPSAHVKQRNYMYELYRYPNVPFYDIVFWVGVGAIKLREYIIIYLLKNQKTIGAKWVDRICSLLIYFEWKMKFFRRFQKKKLLEQEGLAESGRVGK